jgi:hypothetical protein
LKVAAYIELIWNAEAHYVPSSGDHSCYFVGWRIFSDAYQQLLYSPADYLRGNLTDHASGPREQII